MTTSTLIIYNMDPQGAFRILVEGLTLLVALHFLDFSQYCELHPLPRISIYRN